ncbi:MAG: hypothetical protein AAFV53_05035 [Myxococcota bacterium]
MLLWFLACVPAEPANIADVDVSDLGFLTPQQETVAPGATATLAVQPQDDNGSGLSPVSIFFAVSDEDVMELDGGDLIFVTSADGTLDGSEYTALVQTTLTLSSDVAAGNYRVWCGQAHPGWNQESGAFNFFEITVEEDTSTEETQ